MVVEAGEEFREELLELEGGLDARAGEGVRPVQAVEVERRVDHGDRGRIARRQDEVPVVTDLHGAEAARALQGLAAKDEVPGRDREGVGGEGVWRSGCA